MATTKFKTTMDAFKDGVKKMPIDKAVQNIEGWEDYLQKHEGEGTKAVRADLGKLKKLLGAEEVDGEAVNKLLEKMGKDTVKAAGKEDNAEAKHIRELGEALTAASEEEDEDADEDDEDVEDDELVEGGDDEDEDEVEDDDEELEDDDDLEDADDEEEDEDDVEDEPKPAAKKAAKAPAKKSASKTAPKKSK